MARFCRWVPSGLRFDSFNSGMRYACGGLFFPTYRIFERERRGGRTDGDAASPQTPFQVVTSIKAGHRSRSALSRCPFRPATCSLLHSLAVFSVKYAIQPRATGDFLRGTGYSAESYGCHGNPIRVDLKSLTRNCLRAICLAVSGRVCWNCVYGIGGVEIH